MVTHNRVLTERSILTMQRHYAQWNTEQVFVQELEKSKFTLYCCFHGNESSSYYSEIHGYYYRVPNEKNQHNGYAARDVVVSDIKICGFHWSLQTATHYLSTSASVLISVIPCILKQLVWNCSA